MSANPTRSSIQSSAESQLRAHLGPGYRFRFLAAVRSIANTERPRHSAASIYECARSELKYGLAGLE